MTTNNKIKLLDVVALTADLPDCNLWRGQVGTIVEILAEGAGFEVEFCETARCAGSPRCRDCRGCDCEASRRHRNGRTYESIGLRPNQIILLHFEPISPNSAPAMTAN